MKRVTWTWFERLDPALGTYFALWPLGALGFWFFAPSLLLTYALTAVLSLLLFFLVVPWLPGRSGEMKTTVALGVLGLAYAATEVWRARGGPSLRAEGILTLSWVAIYGMELGGLSPHLRSALDPFLARLGIGGVGNTKFAGTVRTDLLLGRRRLTLTADRCTRCRTCQEICPLGVWERDEDGRARLAHLDRCTACTACLKQCEPEAIAAPRTR